MKKLAPVHPGIILLEDFMKPLGLTANALALKLHVPATRIGDIVNGRRAITPDTAARLGIFFGTSTELWLGLQQDYDLEVLEDEALAKIRSEVKPREAAAV